MGGGEVHIVAVSVAAKQGGGGGEEEKQEEEGGGEVWGKEEHFHTCECCDGAFVRGEVHARTRDERGL
jgi:hypothetical protein